MEAPETAAAGTEHGGDSCAGTDTLEERVRMRTGVLSEVVTDLQSQLSDALQIATESRARVGRLITAHEDERARVARELHDGLAQQVSALRIGLDALQMAGEVSPSIARGIERAQALAFTLDRALDRLVNDLRPPQLDHLGLSAALAELVQEFASRTCLTAEYHPLGKVAELRLAPPLETSMYGIAREALRNVEHHAHAHHVGVVFERRGSELVMVIEDDGIGFDPAQALPADRTPLGIAGMRERAAMMGGDLEIESAPGAGAALYVRVPIDAAAATA